MSDNVPDDLKARIAAIKAKMTGGAAPAAPDPSAAASADAAASAPAPAAGGAAGGDMAAKIAAIGEPMGVVAALVPVTNPTSTIIFKVLSAVKAGNAIVCAPHPRGVRCGMETTRIMAEVAEQMGAPKGLIQCLESVTIQGTAELMRHRRTSVVMATGGPAMVKAAYSSGKPTLAVGAGNVPCYVHRSNALEVTIISATSPMSSALDLCT
jgi:acyl-CoA reductase-like NAD-dependent aldehyde dehydrogenase